MNNTVLLIEDNVKLNEINRRALENEGYRVFSALTLKRAGELLRETKPDVILLDVILPDGNGFNFCHKIRRMTDAHILFLTSKREHEDKLRGMSLGGDDYITKPYKLDEMIARVASAMRRRSIDKSAVDVIKKGSLKLDIIAGKAYIEDRVLELTQKEFAVLLYLVLNEGKVIDIKKIYEKVWGQEMIGDENSVRMVVSRLRRKIKPFGYDVNVIRGRGYTFQS